MPFVHHGGFADPGTTGYQHEFRHPLGHDPVEGGEQGLDLALSPIELFGDQQPVRSIVRSELEPIDVAV